MHRLNSKLCCKKVYMKKLTSFSVRNQRKNQVILSKKLKE